MAWLSETQLENMQFKHLGKNVLISEKAAIYNSEMMSIGDNSRIDDFCVVSGKVSIGKNVHFAVFNNISGGELGITFEDFSGLAYGCHVFTQSDDYIGNTLTNPTVPDEFKREIKKKVRIGKHCIVGTGSIILPGVDMADGCSLGAMSMLTKSTEPWGVYFGVPAKKIKSRKNHLLDLERQYIKSQNL